MTQRIKLLDSNNRNVRPGCLLPMLQQLVINFPSAKQDAIDLSRDFRRFVPNDALEISAGAIFQSRNYLWMPQETFGRHDDQRLTPRAQHLAAQTMEILGRCGR